MSEHVMEELLRKGSKNNAQDIILNTSALN